MYIQNGYASIIYKTIVFLLTGLGLYLHAGLPKTFNLGMFKYYTILSNFLCFLYFGAAVIYGIMNMKKAPLSVTLLPRFKGAVTIAILVTLLIYQFILAETPFSMGTGGGSLSNQIVHLYVPVLVVFDWLLFDKKGQFHTKDPFLWCLIPMLYWGGTLVAARLGVTYGKAHRRYPYDFIDIDQLGLAHVLLNVGLLLLAFLMLCYVIFGIDRLLGKGRI